VNLFPFGEKRPKIRSPPPLQHRAALARFIRSFCVWVRLLVEHTLASDSDSSI
jgi:hypothetical protein